MTLTETLHGKCHHCHTQARLKVVGGYPLCVECRYLKRYQDAERALQEGQGKKNPS